MEDCDGDGQSGNQHLTVKHTLHFPAPPGPCSLDQITDGDRDALRCLVSDAKLVIDVGTFLGGSAETMIEAMPPDGMLITIDTFQGTKGANTALVSERLMLDYAIQRLERFKERVAFYIGDSREAAAEFHPGSADLVFLDAAHDYENVKADIEAWLPIVKPGGRLAGHDVDRWSSRKVTMSDIRKISHKEYDAKLGIHPGVLRAVFEKFESVSMSDDQNSSVWWVDA